ncbi:MAG: hypothetical protein ACTSXL_05180 [Alphaproteobacteria bacterium]
MKLSFIKILFASWFITPLLLSAKIEIVSEVGFNQKCINRDSAVQVFRVKCINNGDSFPGTIKISKEIKYQTGKTVLLYETILKKTILSGTNYIEKFLPLKGYYQNQTITTELFDENNILKAFFKIKPRESNDKSICLISQKYIPFINKYEKIKPRDIPTSWIGFDPFSKIIITPEQIKKISKPQWETIKKWVDSGGNLVLINPPSTSPFKISNNENIKVQNHGCGRIVSIDISWPIYETHPITATNQFRKKIWQEKISRITPPTRIGLQQWANKLSSSSDSRYSHIKKETIISKLILSKDEKKQVLQFCFIYIVIIAVVAGPLNLLFWRLIKRARTGWLFSILFVIIGIFICVFANKLIRGNENKKINISWHRFGNFTDKSIVYAFDIFTAPTYFNYNLQFDNVDWVEPVEISDLVDRGTVEEKNKSWQIKNFKANPRAPFGIRSVKFNKENRSLNFDIKFFPSNVLMTVSHLKSNKLEETFIKFGNTIDHLGTFFGKTSVTEKIDFDFLKNDLCKPLKNNPFIRQNMLRFIPKDMLPILAGGWEINNNKTNRSWQLFTAKPNITFTDGCRIPYSFSESKKFEERAGNAYKTTQTKGLDLGDSYRYLLSPGIKLNANWKVSEYAVKVKSSSSKKFRIDFFDNKSNSWEQVFYGSINNSKIIIPKINPENFIDKNNGTLWMKVSTKNYKRSSENLNNHYWEVNRDVDFDFPQLTVKIKK